MMMKNKKIGLALGGGAARGWAHFGIIRALEAQGIKPDIICGTSIGALVGAAYVTNCMPHFEEWVLSLRKRDIAGLLDFTIGGGLIEGSKLMNFLRKELLTDINIEDLEIPYAAVATELTTGNEVWFQNGGLFDAVRASISLPGLFTPVYLNDTWYADGSLVNPVPVSVCRALGAERIIAVDLNSHVVGKAFRQAKLKQELQYARPINTAKRWFGEALDKLYDNGKSNEGLGIFDVLNSAVVIMQDRITRSRMAGDPPDILLRPDLSDIGMMDFDHAAEAIEKGIACVERNLPILDTIR